MKFLSSLLFSLLFGSPSLFVSTQLIAQNYPRLQGRITDTIGLLSPQDKARIKKKLESLDQKTGAELVVIVQSTKPLPIEDYSIRLAEKWKIGKKNEDNGVLLGVLLSCVFFAFLLLFSLGFFVIWGGCLAALLSAVASRGLVLPLRIPAGVPIPLQATAPVRIPEHLPIIVPVPPTVGEEAVLKAEVPRAVGDF